jgi:hypothetical protein
MNLSIISALMHVHDKTNKHYIAKYIHRFGGAVSFGLVNIKNCKLFQMEINSYLE